MGHNGHMGHGDMDMPSGPVCNMNMLFTWDTTDLCIIFHWWHINSTFTLLVSLAAVALLTAGYEGVRELSRRYEASSAEYMNSLPNDEDDSGSYKWLGKSAGQAHQRAKLVKAAFYALQVFYSFFIMLLFMTYNGWVMFSVAVGAFIGYLGSAGGSATKSAACH
ncbi:hypothetical protein MMC13_007172 [Lambiella insularis]|nr:hypothetical protein [Lambiella insularis]